MRLHRRELYLTVHMSPAFIAQGAGRRPSERMVHRGLVESRRQGRGMVSVPDSQMTMRPRLLIVESEPETLRRLASALNRHNSRLERMAFGDALKPAMGESYCTVAHSLSDLHAADLESIDVVICGMCLCDGSGFDALAYVCGTRSDVPVILVGANADLDVASEAVRVGAMDFVVMSDSGMQKLPMVVEKSLVHKRIMIENERLQRDLGRSLAELEVKNQQLEAMIQQLEEMARTDELTGVANRRWLNLMLEGSWAEATRHDLSLACLMIDLDGLKETNDQFGHQTGDDLLRIAAKVIDANSREIDTTGRFGGDEFCVLMPHTEMHEALQVAERIITEFTNAVVRTSETTPFVGMSIGAAEINTSRPVNADQLITHADEALYGAKQAGKNRVMIRGKEGIYAPTST
jgi:diguanylate cyclase (GGDEF)-like protein